MQALGVVALLYARCAEWAAASGGTLTAAEEAVRGPPGSMEMPAVAMWIALGGLKSPARAAEKVLTCYSGDVSRLLDVCRARLVFDSAAGAAACLALVAAAPGVRVVRVRNSLREEHDSWSTAGFRVRARGCRRARALLRQPSRLAGAPCAFCSLCALLPSDHGRRAGRQGLFVNLRFVGPEVLALGAETHVCEVQLLLRPFAALLVPPRIPLAHTRAIVPTPRALGRCSGGSSCGRGWLGPSAHQALQRTAAGGQRASGPLDGDHRTSPRPHGISPSPPLRLPQPSRALPPPFGSRIPAPSRRRSALTLRAATRLGLGGAATRGVCRVEV